MMAELGRLHGSLSKDLRLPAEKVLGLRKG
jgi:hypothetical protein